MAAQQVRFNSELSFLPSPDRSGHDNREGSRDAAFIPISTTSSRRASSIHTSDEEARFRFWETFTREAADHTADLVEKYKSDMDIVLIFSALFSAVGTSFIIAMQPNLSADPNDTTNALLKLLVNTIDNNTFSGQTLYPPVWAGPGSVDIWIQTLAYASLSASLLTALGAVLGKQWLGHFNRLGRGAVDARARLRQQKLEGFRKWRCGVVLEALPVLLQISLLLFGIAL
ncbi:hypothetical protein BV22DRAFT_1171308, partial [Leucogyrophana mollusca]